MADDHCTRCGACCAAFRVDFHVSELASRDGEGDVPDSLTVPLTASLCRMRGTDEGPPRCAALEGEIGRSVRCTIYAHRPSPCRDFSPYSALGIGEDGCDRARTKHGLPLLGG